jgi:hypothetical protein
VLAWLWKRPFVIFGINQEEPPLFNGPVAHGEDCEIVKVVTPKDTVTHWVKVIPTDIVCWQEGMLSNPSSAKEVREWVATELMKGQYGGAGSPPLHVVFDDSILHYQAVCQRAPADSH